MSRSKNTIIDVKKNQTAFETGFFRQHSALLVRMMSLLDAVLIFISLYIVVIGTQREWSWQHLVIGLLGAFIFEMIASFFELYRSWRVIRLRQEFAQILGYWLLTLLLLNIIFLSFKQLSPVRDDIFILWFFITLLLIIVERIILRLCTRYVRAVGYDQKRIAFIGATETAVALHKTFKKHIWMGLISKGFFDNRKTHADDRLAIAQDELAGNIDDAIQLARNGELDSVYICLPMSAENRIKTLIDAFSDTTVSIYYCPSFFNFDLMQARWDNVFGQPVVSVIESPFNGPSRYAKRFEDLCIVIALLPVLIPIMLVVAVLVKRSSSGPVFFLQDRYGIDGKSFKMWKFRTMYQQNCAEGYKQATKNDSRITPLGAYLRRTSLDELPQFINVLLGDMSVVGPRPHPNTVNEDLRKRIHRYMLRHKIKPGITGLAQVNGLRGETETLDKMEQRIAQDLLYIRHWSLWLDIKILFRTLFKLSGENVY